MAAKRTTRRTRRPVRRGQRPRALRRSIAKILDKLEHDGPQGLNPVECCTLVLSQLKAIADWEYLVWDKLWGPGGGAPPPPPPPWPPV